MQGGATARLACAPCRGCWLGKLGRAGWHAALTGKAGTCQLRQTPWHSAQTVSARPRSCWSLSAPSGMPPLPHCACAPAHVVYRHRVCRVRVVLTRCLPLRMSLACTRIFFSKTGCARAQAGGCRCSMRSRNPEVRWRNGGATWLRRMLASYIGDAASCGTSARTTALRYGHRRCELWAPSSTTSYVFRRAFYPHARAVLCQHFHVAHRHRVCRVRAVLTRCLSLRVSLACMYL